ncbi:hypothetical protein TNCV_3480271, partial [Trichonephila clavipes]
MNSEIRTTQEITLNDWLDQSAASYMLAGYSPQSFHIYFSDMGWRLASRAIFPENVTV